MPRIMKSLRLALLLPLLCLTRSVADEVAQLALPERFLPGLEQLLRAAVQQSPQMLNRALDLEIAENNRIAARANLLPNVGGWANYYEAKDARADLPGGACGHARGRGGGVRASGGDPVGGGGAPRGPGARRKRG